MRKIQKRRCVNSLNEKMYGKIDDTWMNEWMNEQRNGLIRAWINDKMIERLRE